MSENVPNGWALALIRDLIAGDGLFTDGDWVESKDQDPEGDVRLIQLADVGDGYYVDKSNRFLTHSAAIELGCTFLAKGDVLVARMPDPLGRACIFPGDKKLAVTVVDVCVVRGRNEHFDQRWLMYFVNAPEFRERINELQSGSTRKRISRGNLSTLQLPIPPRSEQTRIVAKLEELLSDLDAGVAELKAAQKKLAQYRQSLLKAAVEGVLTAEWRANNPPTETGAQLLQRILQERRARWEARQLAKFKEQGKAPPKDWQKKYPEPVQPDTTDLPALPEGWVWASVEQLGHVQLGRQRSPSKVGKANPTPYIRAANITESGVDLSDVLEMEFSEVEKETFALKVGDVLLTEASGSPEHVGRPAIWCHSDGLYCFQNTVLRFSPTGIGSEFAFFSFLAMQKLGVFRRLSGGVGINHLSAGKFSRLPVPLPPVDEQRTLIESIKESFSRCDDQIAFNAHSLKQSAAQRQNILRAAFAGQLVPQDPNDEPASVLLERIRAERAARISTTRGRSRQTKESA
ncbi:MAG: restriction endonuclease subunit S [Xanthomonadaceae bacterium]|nr:restriction endonuclease subunit S [Xanthomonadaceae bacterium]